VPYAANLGSQLQPLRDVNNRKKSTVAKQAAEKGLFSSNAPEKHSSGPKGLLILLYLRHD
jgi:hypothetical protein